MTKLLQQQITAPVPAAALSPILFISTLLQHSLPAHHRTVHLPATPLLRPHKQTTSTSTRTPPSKHKQETPVSTTNHEPRTTATVRGRQHAPQPRTARARGHVEPASWLALQT
ncbi:hypothetical protein EDC01DRAFT_784256 [Geopyxis carbonaria]|nr:hypothetical protein EDC01DRAFT_784256 [Geopyxis carbonaria]